MTFLHSAAEGIAGQQKPAFLYYLGDHDPSGVDIPRKVERDLRYMSGGAEIHLERIAVNLDQVEAWGLSTRPTKRTNTRAKTFKRESVEVDAIPPSRLRTLVSDAITLHTNPDALARIQAAEDSERDIVRAWAEGVEGDRLPNLSESQTS